MKCEFCGISYGYILSKYLLIKWVGVVQTSNRFANDPKGLMPLLKTYAAISNAHLSRVCKRGKLSGSCLSTLNGFGSTQLPIFLCHIGVPTFSSQNK